MFYILDEFDLTFGQAFESAEAAKEEVGKHGGCHGGDFYYAIVEVNTVSKRAVKVEITSDITEEVTVQEVIDAVRNKRDIEDQAEV